MSATSTTDLLSMVDTNTWSSMTEEEQAAALNEYFAAGGTLEDLDTAIEEKQSDNDDTISQDKSYYTSVADVSTDSDSSAETQDDLLASIQAEIDDYNAINDELDDLEEAAQTASEDYTAHNVTADGDYTTEDTLDGSTTVVEVTNTSADPFSTTDGTTFEQYLIDEGITDATTGVVLKDLTVDGEFTQADIDMAKTNYESTIVYQFITLTANSDEAWQLVTWDPSTGTVKLKKYNVENPDQYAYYEFHVDSLNPPPPTLRFIFQGGVDTTSVDTWPPELLAMSFYGTSTSSIADEIAVANGTATEEDESNLDVIPNYTETVDGLTSSSVTQYVDGTLTGDNLTLAQEALDILYSYLDDPTQGTMTDAVAEMYQLWTEAGLSPEEIAQQIQAIVMTVAINDYPHFSTFFASVKATFEQSLGYAEDYTTNTKTAWLALEGFTGGDITAFFSPEGATEGTWPDHDENKAALTNLIAIEALGGIVSLGIESTLIDNETAVAALSTGDEDEIIAYSETEADALSSNIGAYVHQYNINELVDSDCTTEGEASEDLVSIINTINSMWEDGDSITDIRAAILSGIKGLTNDEEDDVAALLTALLKDKAPTLFTALFADEDFKTSIANYIWNGGAGWPQMVVDSHLDGNIYRQDIVDFFAGYHENW